jgi:hypothetical protein
LGLLEELDTLDATGSDEFGFVACLQMLQGFEQDVFVETVEGCNTNEMFSNWWRTVLTFALTIVALCQFVQ